MNNKNHFSSKRFDVCANFYTGDVRTKCHFNFIFNLIAIFAIFFCLNLRTKLTVPRLIVAKEKFFKKFKFVFVKS